MTNSQVATQGSVHKWDLAHGKHQGGPQGSTEGWSALWQIAQALWALGQKAATSVFSVFKTWPSCVLKPDLRTLCEVVEPGFQVGSWRSQGTIEEPWGLSFCLYTENSGIMGKWSQLQFAGRVLEKEPLAFFKELKRKEKKGLTKFPCIPASQKPPIVRNSL